MNKRAPLIDNNGEVRELTAADLRHFKPAAEVLDHARHPYTRALVSAIPTADPDKERSRQRIVLAGDPPSPINPPAGCAFHPRCPHATEACKQAVPALVRVDSTREVACVRWQEI